MEDAALTNARQVLLMWGYVAMALVTCGAVSAETFYSLQFDNATLTREYVLEDDHSFRHRRKGGGVAPEIEFDVRKWSRVLSLSTEATPETEGSDRAELTIYSGVDFGRELFLGFEVFIPNITNFSETWHLLSQCHQVGTQLPPPISLNLNPRGELVVVSRNESDTYSELWAGPIAKGKWIGVVLGFRMGRRGQVQLWLDGREKMHERTALGWQKGSERCVLKIGLYRGPSETPFEIRFDNIILGSTFEAAQTR